MAAYSAVDRIDGRILTELQADARLTNQALAQRIGLSASACLARVRRMEASGLIAGYHARVAVERIAPAVMLFAEVTLERHRPADFAAFEAFALGIPQVVAAAQVSGAFDYLLQVMVADMRAWRELSDRLLGADLAVAKISSHVIMKEAKPFTGWLIGG